jgi:cytoskeletal protein CcmA (bactofilin family)
LLFDKKKKKDEERNTYVGTDVRIVDGVWHCEGDIELNCKLVADVWCGGEVTIGPTGEIFGTLRAAALGVLGTLNGNAHISGAVVVENGAAIIGDICCAQFSTNGEVTFYGTLSMPYADPDEEDEEVVEPGCCGEEDFVPEDDDEYFEDDGEVEEPAAEQEPSNELEDGDSEEELAENVSEEDSTRDDGNGFLNEHSAEEHPEDCDCGCRDGITKPEEEATTE